MAATQEGKRIVLKVKKGKATVVKFVQIVVFVFLRIKTIAISCGYCYLFIYFFFFVSGHVMNFLFSKYQ